jgi:HAD superfamily hydrolase (TIGR01509 family)
MIRAVIFDLDGTVVDSNELHVSAWDRAFRHFGKHFPRQQLRKQIGKGADQYLPEFLNGNELHTLGPKIDKYRSHLYETEYLPKVRPFPKIRELFERIKRGGKKIALASSGKKREVAAYKKIAEIAQFIGCETSADDAAESKPAPDIFEASLRQLGNPPPETAVTIGDTPYDIEAAGRIGLRTIGLLCGGFKTEALHGAAAIYADPADLLEHYDASLLAD